MTIRRCLQNQGLSRVSRRPCLPSCLDYLAGGRWHAWAMACATSFAAVGRQRRAQWPADPRGQRAKSGCIGSIGSAATPTLPLLGKPLCQPSAGTAPGCEPGAIAQHRARVAGSSINSAVRPSSSKRSLSAAAVCRAAASASTIAASADASTSMANSIGGISGANLARWSVPA